jgi:predicted nucleic acid-binding protein
MVVARITPEYTLKIPDEFRPMIEAGQEVAISADAQGRLVVTPIEQIRARLMETFGMWAGRDDLAIEGVDEVLAISNVELGDALIAATAAQAGADLVTRNLKHYPMPDIHVITPYERGRR